MISLGIGIPFGRRGGGFTAEYKAILARATALGYTLPSAAVQAKQNQLMKDLIDLGFFATRDVFYVFAGGTDSDFATLNWKNPLTFPAVKVNSPTFAASSGFEGNGTTSYLDLNWTPSINGVNFQANNHSFGAFNSKNNAQTGVLLSSFGTNFNEISNDNPNNRLIVYDNTGLGDLPSLGANAQNGFLEIQRNNSLNYQAYKNAVSLASYIRTTVAVSNAEFRIFTRSNSTFFGNGICPFAHIGASYTNRTDVYNAINNYLISL
jgi:hypothetical protein